VRNYPTHKRYHRKYNYHRQCVPLCKAQRSLTKSAPPFGCGTAPGMVVISRRPLIALAPRWLWQILILRHLRIRLHRQLFVRRP